jgi:copper transport protein
MKRLTLLLVAVVAALGAPLVAPGAALAHAYLAHSTPADGAVLDTAPSGLTLNFTESVELKATRIEIVDGDGRHWNPTSIALRPHDPTAPEGDSESPVDVVVGLPNLPANSYRVVWTTLSTDDLHATQGDFTFGVQRQVRASVAPLPSGPAPLETILRGLGLVGTAVLFGGAALALLLAVGRVRGRTGAGPDGTHSDGTHTDGSHTDGSGADGAGTDLTGAGPPPDAADPGPDLRRRLLTDAAFGGILALLALPALLLVQISAAQGSLGELLGGELSDGRWIVRELSLAVLVGVVWWVRGPAGSHRRLPVQWMVLAGVVAAVHAGATALLGHPTGGTASTVITGGVHVLAAGTWAGAVVTAALALVPRGRDRWSTRGRLLLRAFAPLAVTCVGALTVTGLLMAAVDVSTVDALLTTAYGKLLLAKSAAVLIAGLLGLRTALRLRAVRAGSTDPNLRSGLVTEGGALVLVLLLAAALAASGPARGARFDTGPRLATVPESTGQVADLVDTVSVGPNRPGPNVVTVAVSQTRRPVPGPVSAVSVDLRGPDGTSRVYPLVRGSDGKYAAPVRDIGTAGQWQIVVTVYRTGLPPVTDAHRWVVGGATASAAAVVYSAQPVRPWALLGAWLAALALAAAAGVAVWRNRRWWAARIESRRWPAWTDRVRVRRPYPTAEGAGVDGKAEDVDEEHMTPV